MTMQLKGAQRDRFQDAARVHSATAATGFIGRGVANRRDPFA